MALNTSKLQLTRPESIDFMDPTILGNNFQKLDDNVGALVCTSTTRPSSPYVPQKIFETDTKRLMQWDGSIWFWVGGAPIAGRIYRAGGNIPVTSGGARPAMVKHFVSGGVTFNSGNYGLTIPIDGLYVLTVRAWTNGSSAWSCYTYVEFTRGGTTAVLMANVHWKADTQNYQSTFSDIVDLRAGDALFYAVKGTSGTLGNLTGTAPTGDSSIMAVTYLGPNNGVS